MTPDAPPPERLIVNTYEQMTAAGGDQIAVCWTGETAGPGSYRWFVRRLVDGRAVVTRPDAPWYDYKLKAFSGWPVRREKAPALEKALAWVRATYPQHAETVFVRNRLGDYVAKEVNDRWPIRRQ